MRRRFAWLAVAAVTIGAFTLLYRGPARELIRGYLGDVAATMLVYALIGFAWRARRAIRAITTLAIAVAIELGQTVWQARSSVEHVLIGSTFDPLDLVAYALGVLIALVWDRPDRIP